MVSAQMVAQLNDSQREAVTSTAPAILCLAGAGTGKTRTLAYRVAYLHHEHRVGTTNMLCMTFTRLAGKELKERIIPLVGEKEAKKLFCNTFHAFAVMVLRQHGALVGLDKNFSIYDEDDRKAIIEEITGTLGGKTSYNKAMSIRAEHKDIALIKIKSPEEYRVLREYSYVLKRNNAVDLDDLISTVNHLWREHKEVLSQYQKEYTHVFIDEFQDTNDEQMEMLALLSPQNLFVVGDDMQAIYGWRQAKVEYILSFHERFPQSQVIKLQDNYRSSGEIVSVANRLITHNKNQSEKSLVAHNHGPAPTFRAFPDETDEAIYVASEIQRLIATGHTAKQIAVLARTNSQVRRIKNVLDTNAVPAQVINNADDVFKRQDIRAIFAWLEILQNNRAAIALKKAVAFPKEYMTKHRVNALEADALANDRTLFDSIVAVSKLPPTAGHAQAFVADYNRVRDAIQKQAAWTPSACFKILVDALQVGTHYGSQGLHNRIKEAEEAYAACIRWERSKDIVGEDKSITSFLHWLRYRDIQEKLIEDKDAVKLMTVHASKGLEFSVVFVIGVSQGVFPSQKTQDIEEERRLFYVALTRAANMLIVTWPEEISPVWGGNPKKAEASQFIAEAMG